jgi:hypothetical protein
MIENESIGNTWSSYIFMSILGIRALSQLNIVSKYSGFTFVTILAFLLLYIISMYGVFLKRKWGSMVAIKISIIEILFVFAFTAGYNAMGSVIMNVFLIALGYLEYITNTDRGHRIASMW